MGDWAILEITDGTDAGTVSLLSSAVGFNLSSQAPLVTSLGASLGVHHKDWRPAIAQPKGGGVWQDSPLSSLRQNVHSVLATSNEVFNLKINGEDQDSLIFVVQEFLRLLLLARDYWIADRQDKIVFLKAQAKCETNPRFADIRGFTIQELENPYGELFFNTMLIAAMDNITLGIERGHWGASIPGTGRATTAKALQSWDFDTKWEDIVTGAVPSLPAPSTAYNVLAVGNDTVIVGPNNVNGLDDMYRSTDKGDSWAAIATGANVRINDFLKIADTNILASDQANGQRILRSVDRGVTFTVLSTQIGGGPLALLNNGDVLSSNVNNQILRSIDQGATWFNIASLGTTGIIHNIVQSPTTFTIIAKLFIFSGSGSDSQIYRSIDNGGTWTLVWNSGTNRPNTTPDAMAVDQEGNFYFVDIASPVWKSIDDGITWAISGDVNHSGEVVFLGSNNEIYVITDSGGGGVTEVNLSVDGGFNFIVEADFGGGESPQSMSESDESDLYLGMDGLARAINDAQDFGGTSSDRIEIVNKHNIAQLTHIFVNDGGVFGANQFPVTAAFALFPAIPVVNDAVYFGINTALPDSGPFCGLRFDISTVLVATGAGAGITIVWEYFDDIAGWSTLSVQDNTALTDPFDAVGINSVHWEQPGGWITTGINGVTGYWIRARISAVAGTITSPQQDNEDIFALVVPFVEILAADVLGDLSAILQVKAVNRSDEDGRGGSIPDLWENRLIVGLKSGGNNFTAFLNASDEQNPIGVIVTLGDNTSFVTDASVATGRRVDFDPAGSVDMATRITWSLGPSIARDFYGTYHVFLRGQRAGGVATDFTIRLRIETGSGGIIFTSENKQFQTSAAWELIDFGRVAIPASGLLKTTELGDQTNIVLQASSIIGLYVPDMSIYDLILIPVDEWAGDFVDGANNDDSIIGHDDNSPKFIDIDSLTFPKRKIRALVRQNGTDLVTSIYRPITNGPAILQANARQKLWFLAAQTDQTGFDPKPNWISPPEIAHSIQLFHNAQYLGMRGAR